ncbi:hypothetical protein M569_11017, partial [Genlisea aurea]
MEVKNPIFLAVILYQVIYAGYFMLTKMAFDVGMNTFVFVFYRQAFATLFLSPFAFFSERKNVTPLSFSTLVKIFLLSLFGVTMSLDIFLIALKYTTATLGAATSNTLPVITFFLALLFRMESVNLRRITGIMKIGGVSVCMGGVITIAFYQGPPLNLMVTHHRHHSEEQTIGTRTWINGVFLMLLANFSWSLWMILQVRVLKTYPSKLMLTTMQCFISTMQSFVVAVAFARDFQEWKIGFDARLLSVSYCGIAVTGLGFYLQSWVIEKKGPVFMAATTPLITVFTMILSVFVLGEVLRLGRVVGAVLLVIGLYFVVWGKVKEEKKS